MEGKFALHHHRIILHLPSGYESKNSFATKLMIRLEYKTWPFINYEAVAILCLEI